MKRYNVRPSKDSSLVAFIMGIGMSIIGIVILVATIASGIGLGVLFVLVWLIGAISITVLHGKNLFSAKGTSLEHIEYEDTRYSFDEELRKLKKLLDDNILSQAEYESKKAEILNKKW